LETKVTPFLDLHIDLGASETWSDIPSGKKSLIKYLKIERF